MKDVFFTQLKHEGKLCDVKNFGYENAKIVNTYHKSFPEYQVTPLANMPNLAKKLGVKGIRVKDESFRFGLNAFKVLGGSYALGHYIADKLGEDMKDVTYDEITSAETKAKLGEITFITATDGNHGRGIAWTANRLGQKSVVYMPKGSVQERLDNIKACGADASITDLNYDDAVRLANSNAEKNGWVMVQDTAWEGYEKLPTYIMQGYTTMGYEITEQMKEKPTHVFLQAGVGAMAGGMTGFIADYYGEDRPIITIVEPNNANCIYQSAKANDGKPHNVGGDLKTIMAGLACGEPCTIGWKVLKDYADNFISMPDSFAEKGMQVLGLPLEGDDKVISGESGAAGMGAVYEILTNPELAEIKKALKLDENSVILCISTEGDTDKENYKKVIAKAMK